MKTRSRLLFILIAAAFSFIANAQNSFVVGKTELTGNDTDIFSVDKLYWGEGVISHGQTPILGMKQTLSTGSALADIRAITYEDGAPYIEDGKLYMTASARTGGNGIVIIALTLGTGELEFTGTVTPLMDGEFRKLAAAHIMYDRQRKLWQITTPFHHPANHLLWIAKAYNDLRFGVTTLYFTPLDYESPAKGDEDCQIFYDKEMKKWVMIYASTRRPDDGSGYILRLQVSKRPDGGFKDYSFQTDVSATGVTTTVIGGKRYVLSGNFRSDKGNRYSVWTYPDMEFVCDLDMDMDDGAYRSWNNVVPVPEGDATRYVMMGFDRQQSTDEDNWTYGNIYFLYSQQRNPGLEFDIKDSDARTIRPATKEFPYRVQDLKFLRRGSRRFAFRDIPLGCIDLEYDITAPKGNVYPMVSSLDSLRYEFGSLMPVPKGKDEAAVIAGIHHPLANYIMPLDRISDGESRYIFIGCKEGGVTARVSATRAGDDIRVSYEGKNGISDIGTFPCGYENSDRLRICFCPSMLTGKFFCFAFCHRK